MNFNSKYTGQEVEDLLDKVRDHEYPDLSGYATKDEVSQLEERTNGKFTEMSNEVKNDLKGKQDVIEDLDAIRKGAARGKTALQTIPSEYVKEDEIPKLVNDVVGGQFNAISNQFNTIGQELNNVGEELTSLENGLKDANDKTSKLETKTDATVTELNSRIESLEQGQGGAYVKDDTLMLGSSRAEVIGETLKL